MFTSNYFCTVLYGSSFEICMHGTYIFPRYVSSRPHQCTHLWRDRSQISWVSCPLPPTHFGLQGLDGPTKYNSYVLKFLRYICRVYLQKQLRTSNFTKIFIWNSVFYGFCLTSARHFIELTLRFIHNLSKYSLCNVFGQNKVVSMAGFTVPDLKVGNQLWCNKLA